jgi:hypothetical protein
MEVVGTVKIPASEPLTRPGVVDSECHHLTLGIAYQLRWAAHDVGPPPPSIYTLQRLLI